MVKKNKILMVTTTILVLSFTLDFLCFFMFRSPPFLSMTVFPILMVLIDFSKHFCLKDTLVVFTALFDFIPYVPTKYYIYVTITYTFGDICQKVFPF